LRCREAARTWSTWLPVVKGGLPIVLQYLLTIITDPQTSHSADFVGAIAGRLDLADTHCNLANHSCIRPSAFASIVVQDKNTVERLDETLLSSLDYWNCNSEAEDESQSYRLQTRRAGLVRQQPHEVWNNSHTTT
jgi:hypothetical protein